jgi:hypothetical protein
MRVENESKVVNFLKSSDPKFLEACSAAKVESSKRQASKWLMKKGIAYKTKFGK